MVTDALLRAVVVTDSSGRLLLWNVAAEQLYGWTEGEVLGRSVLEVLAPSDELDANQQQFAQVAERLVASGIVGAQSLDPGARLDIGHSQPC